MINRVFFILDQRSIAGVDLPSPEENVFYSIAVDPAGSEWMAGAYALLSDSPPADLALTLKLGAPLGPEQLGSLASFLFLPAYLRLGGKPVIILTAGSAVLLRDSAALLSSYLSGQGFSEPLVHTLLPEAIPQSEKELGLNLQRLLKSDPCHGHDLFFQASAGTGPAAVLASLRSLESAFSLPSPQLYALIRAHASLEEKFNSLQRKYAASALELQHQQQYVDVLRSDHAAKEIQEFYNREYEILPLWYKRFGQVLKVLTGKRTFSSLFRDNVKKYKV
jgi:hypothetical protein